MGTLLMLVVLAAVPEGEVIAKHEFVVERAKLKLALPEGVEVALGGPVFSGIATSPVTIPVELVLPADADGLGSRPTVAGLGAFRIHGEQPLVLSRPAYAKIPKLAAELAPLALAALNAAREKLHALPQYTKWRQSKWAYTTVLVRSGTAAFNVYFRATDPIETLDFTVENTKVTAIYEGARRTQLFPVRQDRQGK